MRAARSSPVSWASPALKPRWACAAGRQLDRVTAADRGVAGGRLRAGILSGLPASVRGCHEGDNRSMGNQIAAAANTVVPALLALESLGYTVVEDGSVVVATAGSERFAADDPVTVLGLVKLIETRSWNWRASDEEIAAVLGKFGWSPGPG